MILIYFFAKKIFDSICEKKSDFGHFEVGHSKPDILHKLKNLLAKLIKNISMLY